MAEPTADNIDADLAEQAYEVILNEKGPLVVLDKEPQTSWSQRFAAGFMRILPMRDQ